MKIDCLTPKPGSVWRYSYGDGEVQVGEFQVHHFHFRAEEEWSIWGVEVYPAYRGYGHGRELMKRALDEVRAKGGKRCVLFVKEKNAVAIQLYNSLGFHPTVRWTWGDVRMEKTLA